MVAYQSLITRSVYDKQLDSGRGTLLHLCDEVIQQEVSNYFYFQYVNIQSFDDLLMKVYAMNEHLQN